MPFKKRMNVNFFSTYQPAFIRARTREKSLFCVVYAIQVSLPSFITDVNSARVKYRLGENENFFARLCRQYYLWSLVAGGLWKASAQQLSTTTVVTECITGTFTLSLLQLQAVRPVHCSFSFLPILLCVRPRGRDILTRERALKEHLQSLYGRRWLHGLAPANPLAYVAVAALWRVEPKLGFLLISTQWNP